MSEFFSVVPAAGIGARMGADKPKSYLSLNGETIFSITLKRLLATELFKKVVVVLSSSDQLWKQEPVMSDERIITASGGAERHLSVMSGLTALGSQPSDEDWVMVHDIARPCVTQSDIHALVAALTDAAVGGILATPIKDTLKRVDEKGEISATVSRENLWAALTPQMFRFSALNRALRTVIDEGTLVTDEASAIEAMGWSAKIVQGSADNIKVTLPEDLRRAELILASQS